VSINVFCMLNVVICCHCPFFYFEFVAWRTLFVDLTAVDRFFYANRFMLLYCFVNLSTGFRIFVKVFVPEHGFVPSLSNIIASSNWLEREVWICLVYLLVLILICVGF